MSSIILFPKCSMVHMYEMSAVVIDVCDRKNLMLSVLILS